MSERVTTVTASQSDPLGVQAEAATSDDRKGPQAQEVAVTTARGWWSSLVYDVAARGSLIVVLAGLVIVFTLLKGSVFFSASNFEQILSAQAAVGVLALAVTTALICGEIDLSVAGVMGTVAAVAAYYLTNGTPAVLAVAIGMAIALAFGIVNGLLVTYARMSSIIATLATGTIATGVGLAIVGPDTISGLPGSFSNVFVATWSGIQTPFFMFLGLIVIAAVILQRTPVGRRFFFVGQSTQASDLLGIRVRRLKIGGLVVSALLAGVAGVLLVGQSDGANVTETTSYLLPAFAAAFLGTAAITPGRFNAIGTFVATIVLGTATVGLDEAGVPNWTTYVFDGGLLVVSLGIFTLLRIRRERAAKTKAMQEAAAMAGRSDAS